MDIVGLIESIISSVPEATQLWQKIAPLVSTSAEIPEDVENDINELAPVAQAAVGQAASAITALVQVHTQPLNSGGSGQIAAATIATSQDDSAQTGTGSGTSSDTVES